MIYWNKSYINAISQNILLFKFNVFFILTKHLHTMTITFAFWISTAKLAQISFSFFKISQKKRYIFTTDLHNLSIHFFPFLNLGTFTFSLKGNTIWIVSITILGLWESLLSKIRVTWILALWYHNSQAGKWEDPCCPVTKSCPNLCDPM